MRAKAEIEEAGKRGDRFQIVVTEMPYQVVARTPSSAASRSWSTPASSTGIADVNDESAGMGTRLVIELKRDANANVVLNNLFKLTQLQTSFPVNMVALVDGVPRTLNLVQALQAYIAPPDRGHHPPVASSACDKARERAHMVEGLLRALDMIDAIIALIRASDDRATARDGLMAEPFSFSEVQANYILDMRLVQLTRLSRERAARTSWPSCARTIAELEAILADEGRKREVIKDELAEVRAEFATPRAGPAHPRHRRDVDRGPHRRQGARRRHDAAPAT